MKASEAKKLSDTWRLRCNFDQEFFDRLKTRMYEFIEAGAKVGKLDMTFDFWEIIKDFGKEVPMWNNNEIELYKKKLKEDLVANGYTVRGEQGQFSDATVSWNVNTEYNIFR